jgi:succinyl-CoA synthetase beta subunit
MTIKDKVVGAVLLEGAVDIAREFYLGITLDRRAKRPVLIVSTKGGMDIEQVAREEPQAMQLVHLDPLLGLRAFQVRRVALWSGLSGEQQKELAAIIRSVWSLYQRYDATLVEINPLCLTTDGHLVAVDAKVTIDGNALYLHPEFDAYQGVADGRERRAKEAGLDYVSLDGEVGILGNGAGLVMSMLDLVAAAGGRPADFLDLHGGVKAERIEAAFEILLSDEHVSAVLMVVFAAITRGEEVAQTLLDVLANTKTELPVVIRLTGTHSGEGRAILDRGAPPNLHSAGSITEAVKMVVALAQERSAARATSEERDALEVGSAGRDPHEAGTGA